MSSYFSNDRNSKVRQPSLLMLSRMTIATLSLCCIGLALSVYTLWVHFEPSALACIQSGPINCHAVLTSPESIILNIPVPYFGILFFIFLGGLCLPWAWESRSPWVPWARLILSSIGVAMVVYLIFTELFTVKEICLWCTGVHIVTFMLFVLIVTSTPNSLGMKQHAGNGRVKP